MQAPSCTCAVAPGRSTGPQLVCFTFGVRTACRLTCRPSCSLQDKLPQNVIDEINSAISSTRELAQSSDDAEAIRAKVRLALCHGSSCASPDVDLICCTGQFYCTPGCTPDYGAEVARNLQNLVQQG